MKNRKTALLIIIGSIAALSLLFFFLWLLHQQNKNLQKSFVESREALQPLDEVEWLRLLLRLQPEIQNQKISEKHEPYFTQELLQKIKTRSSQVPLAPWVIHSIQLQETQAQVLSQLPDTQSSFHLAAAVQIDFTPFSTAINNALGKHIKEARLIKIDNDEVQNTFTVPEHGYVLLSATCPKNSAPIKWSHFLTEKIREETRENFADSVTYSALIEVTFPNDKTYHNLKETAEDWSWSCPSKLKSASGELQTMSIEIKKDKNLRATWINGNFSLVQKAKLTPTRPASTSNYQNLLEQKLSSPKE